MYNYIQLVFSIRNWRSVEYHEEAYSSYRRTPGQKYLTLTVKYFFMFIKHKIKIGEEESYV